jgi:hypothetical protein
MDKQGLVEDKIDWIFANLMMVYNGGLTFSDLNNMPIPQVLEYNKHAERINRERESQMKKRR